MSLLCVWIVITVSHMSSAVFMSNHRLGFKTLTHCVYVTGFSMSVREHVNSVFRVFHEQGSISVKPEGLYIPSATWHEALARLEWCIPTNGPPKYSLWDGGNSQACVRDLQTHTHTAAFCHCEFMSWGNDKNSTQRVVLWPPCSH